MRGWVLAVGLVVVGCGRNAPAPTVAAKGSAAVDPWKATPPPRDAAIVANDATPLDASVTAPDSHRFLRFDPQASMFGAFEPAGLPASNGKGQLAVVGWVPIYMIAPPIAAIYTLSASNARKLGRLTQWGENDNKTTIGDRPEAEHLALLTHAIATWLDTVDAKLHAFTPLSHCVAEERELTEAEAAKVAAAPPEHASYYCDGHATWTCNDATLAYETQNDGAPARFLTVTRNGKSKRVASTTWRLPPVDLHPADLGTMPTTNCIHDASMLPDGNAVLVELWHACMANGDWCTVGEPTWHIVPIK